jgi:hypothetical protein
MSTIRRTRTYDDALVLHEYATAITASAGGSDAAHAAIVANLGNGFVEGDIIVDVSELDVDTGNEIVTIGVQISDDDDFSATYYQVASLAIGDAAVIAGDTDMTTGRYIIPFNNLIKDGQAMKYLRLYFTIAGTVAGFKCVAYLTKKGA